MQHSMTSKQPFDAMAITLIRAFTSLGLSTIRNVMLKRLQHGGQSLLLTQTAELHEQGLSTAKSTLHEAQSHYIRQTERFLCRDKNPETNLLHNSKSSPVFGIRNSLNSSSTSSRFNNSTSSRFLNKGFQWADSTQKQVHPQHSGCQSQGWL
jgi:hypothetical protein